MFFKVKVSISAKKFISKLDGSYKKKIDKFIKSLSESPIPRQNKHILDRTGSSMLCEFSVDELRFYYTIENQFVIIEDIEYKGIVEVLEGHSSHKSGNKKNFPNQRRDISKLKKWFQNLFKISKNK
jgi:mRNA-degrading endonuclease RelE of RelBE toxin-antitoxin system